MRGQSSVQLLLKASPAFVMHRSPLSKSLNTKKRTDGKTQSNSKSTFASYSKRGFDLLTLKSQRFDAAVFRLTAAPMISSNPLVDAPDRSASLRLTSAAPKRHTFRFPSAISRSRLHPVQDCKVVRKEICWMGNGVARIEVRSSQEGNAHDMTAKMDGQ